MHDVDLVDVLARLRRLEARATFMRWASASAFAAAAVVLLSGTAGGQEPPRTLSCQRLELLNSRGKIFGVLGLGEGERPFLELMDVGPSPTGSVIVGAPYEGVGLSLVDDLGRLRGSFRLETRFVRVPGVEKPLPQFAPDGVIPQLRLHDEAERWVGLFGVGSDAEVELVLRGQERDAQVRLRVE